MPSAKRLGERLHEACVKDMQQRDLNNVVSSLMGASHKVVNRCFDEASGKTHELLQVQMDRTVLDYIIKVLKEKLDG